MPSKLNIRAAFGCKSLPRNCRKNKPVLSFLDFVCRNLINSTLNSNKPVLKYVQCVLMKKVCTFSISVSINVYLYTDLLCNLIRMSLVIRKWIFHERWPDEYCLSPRTFLMDVLAIIRYVYQFIRPSSVYRVTINL